jgi:glutathione-independent formaldehyde dehydrogenase
MKAVVYRGARNMRVEEVRNPKIQEPRDAIIKVTSAAICGSDLHMYEGRTSMERGRIFGHEILGVIDEVGDGVEQLKVGDRVSLPFNIACGQCFNCQRGFTNACLTMNPDPEIAGAAYGYANMGPYEGGQAQYVRAPYADFNALKLPGEPFDEFEDDFVLLADIFPTAHHATHLAGVKPGYSLVIYGAGPVGLLSVMSAQIRGAYEIYIVDHYISRLELARELGAIPIDLEEGNAVDQIKMLRTQSGLIEEYARPGEEKIARGVLSGIDAVGYQAHDNEDLSREHHSQILDDLTELVLPTGQLGIIGVYLPEDPGERGPAAKGSYTLPWGMMWTKGFRIGTGQCPVRMHDLYLRDEVIGGRAHPGAIVTHHIPIEKAPEMYERFDRREEGVIKAVINPNGTDI